jgi:hypothetical protein
MNQGLVGTIIKSMGRVIVVIKDLDQAGCNLLQGAQFFDNECHMISKIFLDGANACMNKEDSKLMPGKYGIDMVQFYDNVIECKENSGKPSFNSVTSYPACFFNLKYGEIRDSCRSHSCKDPQDCGPQCFSGCDYRFELNTGTCVLNELEMVKGLKE